MRLLIFLPIFFMLVGCSQEEAKPTNPNSTLEKVGWDFVETKIIEVKTPFPFDNSHKVQFQNGVIVTVIDLSKDYCEVLVKSSLAPGTVTMERMNVASVDSSDNGTGLGMRVGNILFQDVLLEKISCVSAPQGDDVPPTIGQAQTALGSYIVVEPPPARIPVEI